MSFLDKTKENTESKKWGLAYQIGDAAYNGEWKRFYKLRRRWVYEFSPWHVRIPFELGCAVRNARKFFKHITHSKK